MVEVTKLPDGVAEGAYGLRNWSATVRGIRPDVLKTKKKESRKQRKKKKQRLKDAKALSDAFLASYEWRKLRYKVLKERGARCECCGRTPKDGLKMHVDHIKPRKKYPELALTESNLQILCEECNHGKGNWDETDWR